MDSEKVKKKFFDITPPQPSAAPSAPTVPKRQMIAVSEATDVPVADDPLLDSKPAQIHKVDDIVPIATKETEADTPADIVEAPKTVDKDAVEVAKEVPESAVAVEATEPVVATPKAEATTVEPLPETTADTTEANATDASTTIDSKETLVKEQYEATDALPDPSQTAAKNIQASMQEPKIYDTTAYHIPIKDAGHGHGGVKMAFLFGAIFAVIVVAGVVYAMVQLGS